jgi:uncharacterized protein YndB with AHSA1/START domain
MRILDESNDARTLVTLDRSFPNLTPARLFDAWVIGGLAEKWLFTCKTSSTVYDLDVRKGGRYSITRQQGGQTYVAVGEYREIARPRRLVFTLGTREIAADYDIVVVEIEPGPEGAGSRLKLTQEGIRPGLTPGAISGWEEMFLALETAFPA